MTTINIVKLDAASDDYIVQKFMSERNWELKLGTQLVVNPGQEAIFVKGGIALDTFGAGTHTLISGNVPLLEKLLNAVFGEKTPFTAEVWFINRTAKRNLAWGTPKRIAVFDPKFGFPVNVGAFGQWGFRIEDSRSFVTQIVGSQLGADSNKIFEYFIGEIVEKITQHISILVGNGTSIVEINSKLTDLSNNVNKDISAEFRRFGIELVNFSISNIGIAPNEMQKIQEVMAKRMEAEQLSSVQIGPGYAAIKNLEILKDVANNNGAAGTIMGGITGAGLALGAGIPLGQQLANSVVQQPTSNSPADNDDSMVRLKKLKNMFEADLITKEEYDSKRAAIIEKL